MVWRSIKKQTCYPWLYFAHQRLCAIWPRQYCEAIDGYGYHTRANIDAKIDAYASTAYSDAYANIDTIAYPKIDEWRQTAIRSTSAYTSNTKCLHATEDATKTQCLQR
jgi:hypothetical protein